MTIQFLIGGAFLLVLSLSLNIILVRELRRADEANKNLRLANSRFFERSPLGE